MSLTCTEDVFILPISFSSSYAPAFILCCSQFYFSLLSICLSLNLSLSPLPQNSLSHEISSTLISLTTFLSPSIFLSSFLTLSQNSNAFPSSSMPLSLLLVCLIRWQYIQGFCSLVFLTVTLLQDKTERKSRKKHS